MNNGYNVKRFEEPPRLLKTEAIDRPLDDGTTLTAYKGVLLNRGPVIGFARLVNRSQHHVEELDAYTLPHSCLRDLVRDDVGGVLMIEPERTWEFSALLFTDASRYIWPNETADENGVWPTLPKQLRNTRNDQVAVSLRHAVEWPISPDEVFEANHADIEHVEAGVDE